jgi:hypothetical protein
LPRVAECEKGQKTGVSGAGPNILAIECSKSMEGASNGHHLFFAIFPGKMLDFGQ